MRWQKWQIRVGFHVRDGLIFHEIGYEDQGRLRPIMHRASMAEMVVPYGDPTGGNYRRNAFDTGEYGVGQLLDSLTLGCDCLGHIHYFDAWSHDWQGSPSLIRNAICMHEEDFGTLWKFTNTLTGQVTVKRSRRLVDLLRLDHRKLCLWLLLVFLSGRHHRRGGEGHRHPLRLRLAGRCEVSLWRAHGAGHRGACAPARLQLPLRHGGGRRAQFA